MANNTATPRSARAAALERRQALSQGGKAALMQANIAAGVGIRKAVAAMPVRATVETVPSAMVQENFSSGDCGCGCKSKDTAGGAEREQAIEAVCAIVDAEPTAVVGPIASAVRKLCQMRRQALSSQGKTAVSPSTANVAAVLHNGDKSGAMGGLSGRDAARTRREALCQQGRDNDLVCRPTGRVRPKPSASVKVETGSTLRGTGVTGTQVERSGKVTGNERGSCRAITGTEYIGAEQYSELCAIVPEPAPAKVSIGSTSRGQRVSGTEVGRSVKVTGDEHGACKTVTGTEYLSADKFESFCTTKLAPGPAKVSVVTTAAGQGVTGTEVGRSTKVTGDEAGACSKLTGSQYVQTDLPASLCGSGIPRKVTVMSTVKGRTVTGTEVGHSVKVTGDEHGACKTVTGTEYAGLEQYQACNRTPVPAPEKIGVMRTWHGQPVSGTSIEHSSKVTGDEYGSCHPVSGTEYIGPDQYTAFCDTERQATTRTLMASHGTQGGAALTGTPVASRGKVTGVERGESRILSGTPYSGSDRRVSQHGVNSNTHPLAWGPFDAPRQPAEVPSAACVQGDFSIATPARGARDSRLNRITGTAYGAIGRITGPVNLAAGLVSGTPGFRYGDEASRAAPMIMGQVQAPEEPRSRLTGDGREGGFAITGAAWRRNESVTGTEGISTRRNPTLRGDQRGVVMGASQNKDRERPEIPPSKITGSSGNDAKGAAITYSGGARG